MTFELPILICWLPALGAVLCGLCCMHRRLRVCAGPICVLSILLPFVVTLVGRERFTGENPTIVHMFNWIHAGRFIADFSYLLDPLTFVMLMVVTGIGTLVAVYACGYMAGDRGYARFFASVALFIFAMTNLVMADNLVLLYLGWEGVGLCSYLLIGYYYDKPSAVKAAKKAFIVNRVGDLGFAIGIFLTYTRYDTVSIAHVLQNVGPAATSWEDHWIPFMLMLGAFGKSAQFPLHVWLPDAMEGPTPVSALIHAATMVTAGVYLIARLMPLFLLSPYALPTVAVVGGLTAFFAATIALCQYDIKRIYAYSTISQLGYMFMGIGVLSTVGGIFHLFTHAFFKALLFLTAGSVIHAMAGQLDLRKMSGLRKKMPWTCGLMFIGCLALAGFPFTAGFYSKDMILAATLERGINHHNIAIIALGVIGLVTALLTALYTFRLWFRVFMGPTEYEMGLDHHGHEEEEEEEADHGGRGDVQVEHIHEPHEVSWLMNGPLLVLAAGALLAGWLGQRHHWMKHMVEHSTAAVADPDEHGVHLHTIMLFVSSAIAIAGIIIAAYFHWLRREAADTVTQRFATVVRVLNNKYYVDKFYDASIVRPLRTAGELCFAIDRLAIGLVVALVGCVPRALGISIQSSQKRTIQGYGLGMAVGVAVILLLMMVMK